MLSSCEADDGRDGNVLVHDEALSNLMDSVGLMVWFLSVLDDCGTRSLGYSQYIWHKVCLGKKYQ